MWKRYLVSLWIVCATFFLLGFMPGEVVAQNGKPVYTPLTGQPAGPGDLALIFKRPVVPVRVHGLDGPDSLATREEGRFSASANIDAASLPLKFLWDFGDGTTATSLHARHRFAAPGIYPVTFTMSNSESEVTDTLLVKVVAPQEDLPAAHHPRENDGMVRLAEIDVSRLGRHLRRSTVAGRMSNNVMGRPRVEFSNALRVA